MALGGAGERVVRSGDGSHGVHESGRTMSRRSAGRARARQAARVTASSATAPVETRRALQRRPAEPGCGHRQLGGVAGHPPRRGGLVAVRA